MRNIHSSSSLIGKICLDIESCRANPFDDFEKNIFFYWHDGYEDAIDIAKIAFEMAKKTNREYKIHFIGKNNVSDYFPYRDEIYMQASVDLKEATFSDLLRCYLVCKYGGIWMDASCLALNKFDPWLDPIMKNNEYFVWRSDSFSDRRVMSWFLAGRRGAFVPGEVCKVMTQFILKSREEILQQTFYPERYCRKELMGPDLTDMRAVAEIERKNKYPYFLMHYIWNHVLNSNSVYREKFDKLPRIPIHIAKLNRRKFNVGELTKSDHLGLQIDVPRLLSHDAIPEYVKKRIILVLGQDI
jgi:hypothetical protein